MQVSTLVVGAILLAFLAIGAANGGFGGALIFLAIFAALTGLYIVATGRRSWARLRGGRKGGAFVLAAAVVLFGVGATTLTPRTPADIDAEAASDKEQQERIAASTSAAATPSATPSPKDTGEPMDPETVAKLAKGVSYTAPKSQPAFATSALDLLATLPVKDAAPMSGYDARAKFGDAWADIDRNGCDTRNHIFSRGISQKSHSRTTCAAKSREGRSPIPIRQERSYSSAAPTPAVPCRLTMLLP